MTLEHDQKVEFEKSRIELGIPYPEGITTENRAWKITPFSPPVVRLCLLRCSYVYNDF